MQNNNRSHQRACPWHGCFILILIIIAQFGLPHQAHASAAPSPEQFVPTNAALQSVTIELRAQANVIGNEVTLKHICRWAERDGEQLAAFENLVLVRLTPQTPYRTISLDEITTMLRDAGMNLGRIRFVGSTQCTVGRSDVQFDQGDALRKWVSSRESQTAPATQPVAATGDRAQGGSEIASAQGTIPATVAAADTASAASPAAVAASDDAGDEQAQSSGYRSLRDVLLDNLASHTGLLRQQLVVDFRPQDQQLLKLFEPHFQFHAALKRGRNLSNVTWTVTITSDGQSQSATISASVRYWQDQVVASQPLAYKQVIRAADILQRRTLVDQLEESPVLKVDQVVGNMAALEIKPGTVITARLVDPVPLVRSGQLVTVSLQQGNIQLKTVARAMESGTFGQTIRVRNETTRNVFEVVMSGPQEATLGAAPAELTAAGNW